MSDGNPENSHDKHAKCPSQFRAMSAINHVNVGQNVRSFKKVFIYTVIVLDINLDTETCRTFCLVYFSCFDNFPHLT